MRMSKRYVTIFGLVISILLISALIVKSTYSLVDGINNSRVSNELNTIKDLLTDDNGFYNSEYYAIANRMHITTVDFDILINSDNLNNLLNDIWQDDNYTDTEIIDAVITAVNGDRNIQNELKLKVINSVKEYIEEINNYLEIKKKNY